MAGELHGKSEKGGRTGATNGGTAGRNQNGHRNEGRTTRLHRRSGLGAENGKPKKNSRNVLTGTRKLGNPQRGEKRPGSCLKAPTQKRTNVGTGQGEPFEFDQGKRVVKIQKKTSPSSGKESSVLKGTSHLARKTDVPAGWARQLSQGSGL